MVRDRTFTTRGASRLPENEAPSQFIIMTLLNCPKFGSPELRGPPPQPLVALAHFVDVPKGIWLLSTQSSGSKHHASP